LERPVFRLLWWNAQGGRAVLRSKRGGLRGGGRLEGLIRRLKSVDLHAPVIRHHRLDVVSVVARRLELSSLQAATLEAAAEDREEHEPAADDEQNDGHEADALPPPRRARRP